MIINAFLRFRNTFCRWVFVWGVAKWQVDKVPCLSKHISFTAIDFYLPLQIEKNIHGIIIPSENVKDIPIAREKLQLMHESISMHPGPHLTSPPPQASSHQMSRLAPFQQYHSKSAHATKIHQSTPPPPPDTLGTFSQTHPSIRDITATIPFPSLQRLQHKTSHPPPHQINKKRKKKPPKTRPTHSPLPPQTSRLSFHTKFTPR
jgi:hypothetical protein